MLEMYGLLAVNLVGLWVFIYLEKKYNWFGFIDKVPNWLIATLLIAFFGFIVVAVFVP